MQQVLDPQVTDPRLGFIPQPAIGLNGTLGEAQDAKTALLSSTRYLDGFDVF
jgi:hypothetical protein